ncbi:hypothetical protein BST81_25925 [Leptolyngbya sp. 'hensonii']|uniref:DUF3082 domain-containing protein n=1 Tax=Leptolyngbya sp. 'hensonii' TaxID=1922337 RepID=UPI0009500CD1|nr:DUF3082 domain-containing protein [Leptolyngbya sp. 'hensonii']OLP15502.1 hypothetical protein BST81_25925 [Leptolyngbya sp. 'hensonii']
MSDQPSPPESPPMPSPLHCVGGAIVAAGISVAFYSLTSAIAQGFAHHPIHTDNRVTLNIAAAVRTLTVGMAALGTGVFALAALGLFALGIQLLLQKKQQPENCD